MNNMGGPNISRILAKAKVWYDSINDQWIDSDEIGVDVTLYYPSTIEDCANCQFTTYGIVYKTGGPHPFNLGNCPACGSGDCKKEVEHTESINLRIYSVDPGSFSKQAIKKIGISIDQVQGDFLTIGKMTDVEKVRACNYAVFFENQENNVGSIRVKLSMDPQPHGFSKDKYFFCYWSRI